MVALVVVAGAVAAASFLARPDKARAFDLFYGSVYLDDTTAPVAVDLASGKPTVQLVNAFNEVSAKASDQLHVVPLSGGTLLLNTATGEFNMLDATGFVLKGVGGGVQLPPVAGSTAAAVASGDSAYIVQSSASQTAVYLVGQATVSAAAGSAGKTGRARATYTVDEGSSDVGATAASANGDLWLLTGSGDRHTIRQLHVPAGSSAGVQLASTTHGAVTGAAGVASAAAGGGTNAIAVASAAGIDVFAPGAASTHASLTGLSGLDTVLPASNEQGRFAFLLHDATGWAVATVGIDGKGAALHRVGAIAPTARLIAPGASEGALYTMDTATGRLWRVATSGAAAPVTGSETYPITSLESLQHFDGADVLARGARVIYNAPQHDLALTVFTDGSAAPVRVDKRSAISVSPNGPALTGLRASSPGPAKPSDQPKGTPKPATPVNEKIDCQKVSQVPHPPAVQLDERGSRSVRLSWTYPQLSPQDCLPSTYTVSISVVAGQAPPPPGTVTVQGSTGVIITGLFPDTQYQMVVTAYINGRGTPSLPLPVRTSVEGPAAPSGVTVTPDNAGNWRVSWNSCGGVQNGCVETVQWKIVPQVCGDTSGLVGAPAPAAVVGDPTLRSFSYSYPAGAGLLGRGLSFVVEGVGRTGVLGDPSAASTCTYSWMPPNPDDIHVAASQPPATSVGGTASVTADVTFTGDQDVATGGVGGQFTYQLLSGGEVVTSSGPTSQTSAVLSGVQPGQAYQVRVVVTPPRHPEASVAVGPVDVTAAVANWPQLTATASFANDHFYDGTLTVTITGITSAQARGETFDLTDQSMLRCGNAALPLTATGFDPAQPLHFAGIDRSQYNGSCTATVQLVEDPATRRFPAYFGGTPSPAVSAPPVSIATPDFVTTAAEFTAGFEANQPRNAPVVAVGFKPQDPQHEGSYIQNNTGAWSLQLSNDGGKTFGCGSSTTNPAGNGAEIAVTPLSCVQNATSWKVRIAFTYFGSTPQQLPFVIDANAQNVPQPVDPSQISFTACYPAPLSVSCLGAGGAIRTTYSGPYSPQVINQLTWTISIIADSAPTVQNCLEPGTSQVPDQSGPTDNWAIDTSACPPTHPIGDGTKSAATVYTITLTYTDPVYAPKTPHSYTYQVPAS